MILDTGAFFLNYLLRGVKMFKRFRGWWKRFNEQIEKEYEVQKQAALSAAKKRLEAKREKMIGKYCPLVNGSCRDSCVHFFPGKIVEHDTWYGDPRADVIPPKCRLWERK